jgi:hypothetical protein
MSKWKLVGTNELETYSNEYVIPNANEKVKAYRKKHEKELSQWMAIQRMKPNKIKKHFVKEDTED